MPAGVMTTRFSLPALLAAASLAAALSLSAQETEPTAASAERSPVSPTQPGVYSETYGGMKVSQRVRFMGESDLEGAGSGSEIESWTSRTVLQGGFAFDSGLRMTFDVAGQYTDYDYTPPAIGPVSTGGSGGLPDFETSGADFGDLPDFGVDLFDAPAGRQFLQNLDYLRIIALMMTFTMPINDTWALYGLLGGSFGAEKGAELTEGGRALVMLGARWQVATNLAIIMGFAYFDRLEDDGTLFPILFLSWYINQHLHLYTRNGAFLEYTFPSLVALSVGLAVTWESYEYRLNAREDVYGTLFRDTALVDEYFLARVYFNYALTRYFLVGMMAGVMMDRELEVRQNGGDFAAGGGLSDVDDSWVVGFEASFRF